MGLRVRPLRMFTDPLFAPDRPMTAHSFRVRVGCELNQIALGRFDTQLRFSGCNGISIQGRWELRDRRGLKRGGE
jgi:hypothetical protein